MTQWTNKGTLTSPAWLFSVLKVPLRHLRPSIVYSVPLDSAKGLFVRMLTGERIRVFLAHVSHAKKNSLRKWATRMISVTSALVKRGNTQKPCLKKWWKICSSSSGKFVNFSGLVAKINVKRGSIAFCCWKARRTIFFLDLPTGHGKSVIFQALFIVHSWIDPTRKSQTVVNTTHKTVNRLAHRQLHLNRVVPERKAEV